MTVESGSTHFDVIIVGGRPAGSTLAARLGQRNIRTLLLERATMPSLPAISSPGIYASTMQMLDEIGADEAFVHAVCSHGYGLCSDVEPTLEMEKVLFAADELTGLVGAAALMRPSKSVQDMELSSLKKKFKDKKFAAGCSRDVIRQGAERLDWELDRLLDSTLQAMRACEADIAAQMAAL